MVVVCENCGWSGDAERLKRQYRKNKIQCPSCSNVLYLSQAESYTGAFVVGASCLGMIALGLSTCCLLAFLAKGGG